MNRYVVVIKHDKGKLHLKVAAENESKAKEIAMRAENCPANAVTCVKLVPVPLLDD